jgi:hypothetical protein
VVTTDVGRTCQAGHGVQVPRVANQRSTPPGWLPPGTLLCREPSPWSGNEAEWLCVVGRGTWMV